MPVFAANVPPFEIRPPTTTGDKGDPSDSILQDAHRIFALIDDERHLVAHKLYRNVRERLNEWWKLQSSNDKGGGRRKAVSATSSRSASPVRSVFVKFTTGKRKKNQVHAHTTGEEYEQALEFLASRKDQIDKLEVGKIMSSQR